MSLRPEAVSGQFYPSDSFELKEFIESCRPRAAAKNAVAIMVPHAGYVYSGKTAAKTIFSVHVPDTVLLLGPNHTGVGRPFSVYSKGEWRTPLGNVGIDEKLARELLEASPYLEENESAHHYEHSLEVQIPFLKEANPFVKIVPITISCHDSLVDREVAEQIAEVLKGKKVLILASSDMTHYESAEAAEGKDRLAIGAIQKMDPDRLWRVVSENKISMCGVIPAFITLIASKKLGATKAELVEYTHSGFASGNFESVVGYAGMILR